VAVADAAVFGNFLLEAQAIGGIGVQAEGGAGAGGGGAPLDKALMVFVVGEGIARAVAGQDAASGIGQVG
jgi:hypothetical protein